MFYSLLLTYHPCSVRWLEKPRINDPDTNTVVAVGGSSTLPPVFFFFLTRLFDCPPMEGSRRQLTPLDATVCTVLMIHCWVLHLGDSLFGINDSPNFYISELSHANRSELDVECLKLPFFRDTLLHEVVLSNSKSEMRNLQK